MKQDSREKEPLSDDEYKRVLKAAQNIGGEHLKTVLMLRWTGMHISVLSNPILYDLKVEHAEDGDYILWKRTKKLGKDAYVSLKAYHGLIGMYDVEGWIEALRSRREDRNGRRISRQYFWTLVKEVGYHAGIPELSPMSFRHTLAVWLLNNGAPESFVKQKLNVSSRVLTTYVKYTRTTEKPMYDKLGW